MAKGEEKGGSAFCIPWSEFWVFIDREDIADNLKQQIWADMRIAQHLKSIGIPYQIEVLKYAPDWVFCTTWPATLEIVKAIKGQEVWDKIKRKNPFAKVSEPAKKNKKSYSRQQSYQF